MHKYKKLLYIIIVIIVIFTSKINKKLEKIINNIIGKTFMFHPSIRQKRNDNHTTFNII